MSVNFTNSVSSDVKPTAHFQKIIDSLLTEFQISRGARGKRFLLLKNDNKMILVLIKGSFDVKRGKDSLLLTTTQSPCIMGLTDFRHDITTIAQAKDNIEYIHITLDDFLKHIGKHNLWESTTNILMFVTSRFHEYLNANVSIPTYEIICNQLHALTKEKFEIRATTSTVKYIMDRTFLSRSGIIKVLSSLDKGGYIVISRGLLIKVNQLPEKY